MKQYDSDEKGLDSQEVGQYQSIARPDQVDGVGLFYASVSLVCVVRNIVGFITIGFMIGGLG